MHTGFWQRRLQSASIPEINDNIQEDPNRLSLDTAINKQKINKLIAATLKRPGLDRYPLTDH